MQAAGQADARGAGSSAYMAHPFVALMRRYCVDYLACGNPDVCREIMEPDYVLHMGGHDLGPRDEVYVPAVVKQLQQFPGLGMTVNELICSGDRLAMRFSQHGASVRHGGRVAAWAGVGLYRWNGTRLTENYALEDYHSRRTQLAAGFCNPVEGPAPAPWDVLPVPADPAAEEAVDEWLASGSMHATAGVVFDDEWAGHPQLGLVDVDATVVDDLLSAGARVAFHVTQTGTYAGGLDGDGPGGSSLVGARVTMRSAGIVVVDEGRVTSGRVVRDRAGMLRSAA